VIATLEDHSGWANLRNISRRASMAKFGGSYLFRRGRWQLILSAIFSALTLLALIVPVWIEEVTGRSPDGGNGEVELLLAVPFGMAALVLGALGWRSGRPSERPGSR
jgi:hypothetical protein